MKHDSCSVSFLKNIQICNLDREGGNNEKSYEHLDYG